jgi:hypothetical protein
LSGSGGGNSTRREPPDEPPDELIDQRPRSSIHRATASPVIGLAAIRISA